METELNSAFDINIIHETIKQFKHTYGHEACCIHLLPTILNSLLDKWLPEQTNSMVTHTAIVEDLKAQLNDVNKQWEEETRTFVAFKNQPLANLVQDVKVCVDFGIQTDEMLPVSTEASGVDDDDDEDNEHIGRLEQENKQLLSDLEESRRDFQKLTIRLQEEVRQLKQKSEAQRQSAESVLQDEIRKREDVELELKTMVEQNRRFETQLRESQDRVVQVHKSSLEELWFKDAFFREKASEWQREQLELQTVCAEERRSGASTSAELAYLKRQLNDYEDVQIENKK